MINSTLVLVVAMLSPARGWGLPSHNSPNETTTTGGVDGARDRRQMPPTQTFEEIRGCNGGWSAVPTPRLLSGCLLPNCSTLTLLLPSCPQRHSSRGV